MMVFAVYHLFIFGLQRIGTWRYIPDDSAISPLWRPALETDFELLPSSPSVVNVLSILFFEHVTGMSVKHTCHMLPSSRSLFIVFARAYPHTPLLRNVYNV
jgi:hypothetical protein